MRNRRRDARHPVVIATFAGLAYTSAAQLVSGPGGSTVIRAMSALSQNLFAALLFVSVGACLVSAWITREPLGARTERAGMLGSSIALLFYAFNVPEAVAAWGTTMAVVFFGTALGCAVRAGLVWRMIRHRETW
jgi:hypothetical protein